jgi:hypothetical protein
VLDFDPRKSVVPIGRGRYLLKPVIHVEEVSYTPVETENQPPSASFNDLQVSGADSQEVNGFYREIGFNQERPKYVKESGGCFLYYLSPFWVITTVEDDQVSNALYYNGDATAVTAPESEWSMVNGQEPLPTVQRVAITGALAVGQTLTGHYLFTDTDGTENESGSTLQWYRFKTVTETDTANGTAIVGATGSTYQLQEVADAAMFLRLQVIPKDDLGAEGTPALSGAVGPVLSND